MKPGINYKTWKGDGNFDVIIIGSGISGLTAAVFLARRGKKVLVLEKHYTLGGFTHVFKRKEFEWDVGVHYIGDVNHPKSAASSIFKYISGGNLEWTSMPNPYDQLIFPDRTVNLRAGISSFREEMNQHFPAESNGIEAYLNIMRKVPGEYSLKYHTLKAFPPLVSKSLSLFTGKNFRKWAAKTTDEALSEFTQNQELKGVLTGQWGDYGLPPSRSSFAVHCMVANHFMNGGAYPKGGSAAFAGTIIPEIEAAGGMVMYNAPVSKIILHKGKAAGVLMADGREFLSSHVISSAGFENTFKHLLSESFAWKRKYLKSLDSISASTGHYCLYLGLDIPFEQLNRVGSNLWIYPGYNHDKQVDDFCENAEADFPVVYVSFPSAKDPDWHNRYPGKSTIEMITLAPYNWVEKWENTRWGHRGEEYEALKNNVSARLLEILYKHVPQARGNITHSELSTPLSTRNFANWQKGEIYGLDHSPARFANPLLRPHTPVKGLFMTGQDIVTCGVAGGMFAGILTASAMLNKNVMKDAFGKK